MNDIEDPIGEAERPQTLRSQVLPPQAEIDAHNLTHQPLRQKGAACASKRVAALANIEGNVRRRTSSYSLTTLVTFRGATEPAFLGGEYSGGLKKPYFRGSGPRQGAIVFGPEKKKTGIRGSTVPNSL